MLEFICILMEIIKLPCGYILSHMIHLNSKIILVTCFALCLHYLLYKICYTGHSLFWLLKNSASHVYCYNLVFAWEFKSTPGNFSYWQCIPNYQTLHLDIYDFPKNYVEIHVAKKLSLWLFIRGISGD